VDRYLISNDRCKWCIPLRLMHRTHSHTTMGRLIKLALIVKQCNDIHYAHVRHSGLHFTEFRLDFPVRLRNSGRVTPSLESFS
jgi:hypothetical protein